MPTSAAQSGTGTTLTFLESLTGINNWSATVATWQDPKNGRFLVQPGMLSPAMHSQWHDRIRCQSCPWDVRVWYDNTFKCNVIGLCCRYCDNLHDCSATAAGTYYGLARNTGAMASAWLNVQSGGSVYMPAGSYLVNHSLINAGASLT